MSFLRDGLFILFTHWVAILVFFISVFGIGLFILKRLVGFNLDYEVRIGASLGIGMVVLCLISIMLALVSRVFLFVFPLGSYVIILFAVFVLLKEVFRHKPKLQNVIRLFPVTVSLFLLLLVRLAFLKPLLLPPYSDSPVHYQIVLDILKPGMPTTSQLSLDNIFSNYYHFGFHSLVAWLATLTNADPLQIIPLVGQLFLIIVPVSSMVMAKVVIGDNLGVFLAGLLSALGWYMPAFAANWGKYPAIGALAALPVITAFIVLWLRHPNSLLKNKPWALAVVAGHAVLHSRAIVCLLLFALAWWVAAELLKNYQFGIFQAVRYTGLYLATLWIFRSYLVDFYSNWPIALTLCVLLPFGFYQFPRVSIALVLFTVGAGLAVVMPPLLGNGFRELLDRQFFQMMIFVPFSIVGAAALTGLAKSFRQRNDIRILVSMIFIGIVFWNSPGLKVIYPDNCCNYFQDEDRLAFEWMQQHVSPSDLILISSFTNQGQTLSTDAGGWIYPLLGLSTNKVQFDTYSDSLAEIMKVCTKKNNVYIYDGGKMFSFGNIHLDLEYAMDEVFSSGRTKVIRISGCER